ncbi:thiamine-phosphate kinase [Snodgrassella alvi]|uniref:Thiamine-monophosphate kinase n=1 Tax=Snodgrassella alvi TaxID=1196083 RepID=A0A2N9X9T7_9NEIS|nr:thiamine-phosphate kinase [Snodgrassella alvi]PIT42258.1 thiamine-phosphate kinase [Snodgrassella alvi]
MTEFDFIQQYLHRQQQDNELVLGIGDDAAIVRPRSGYDLHFSTDMLVGGTHFFTDVAPEDLAHKVLAVNFSDMAAMGATPRWALLSVALPELKQDWLTAFCDALFALARRFGVTLIGGDTTKGNWVFNVTIIGETPRQHALRRDAAQLGDDIWVTGLLGLAAAALDVYLHKTSLPAAVFAQCEAKRLRPEPRVALGKELLSLAHAAQDISDGLAQDINHILKASNVGATINVDLIPSLPDLRLSDAFLPAQLYHWLLAGGDDYELVFTAAPSQREAIMAAANRATTSVTKIGTITAGRELQLINHAGNVIQLQHQGFDHFG